MHAFSQNFLKMEFLTCSFNKLTQKIVIMFVSFVTLLGGSWRVKNKNHSFGGGRGVMG